MAFLLTQALFRQAAQPGSSGTEEEDEALARVRNYNEIQAQRWQGREFHILKDGAAKEDGDKKKQKALEDNEEDLTSIPNHLWIGPFPFPYSWMGGMTLALSSLVFLESWNYDEEYYLSLTKLTSLVDWFRTFFLLSLGVLGAAWLLYGVPVIVYSAKWLHYHGKRCCCGRRNDKEFEGMSNAEDQEYTPPQVEQVSAIQEQFPSLVDTLHGFFPAVGSLSFCVAWAAVLARVAHQMGRRRRQ